MGGSCVGRTKVLQGRLGSRPWPCAPVESGRRRRWQLQGWLDSTSAQGRLARLPLYFLALPLYRLALPRRKLLRVHILALPWLLPRMRPLALRCCWRRRRHLAVWLPVRLPRCRWPRQPVRRDRSGGSHRSRSCSWGWRVAPSRRCCCLARCLQLRHLRQTPMRRVMREAGPMRVRVQVRRQRRPLEHHKAGAQARAHVLQHRRHLRERRPQARFGVKTAHG